MNQERQEAYLNPIQQLLDCQSGEEVELILTANQELLDADFLQTLQAVAQMCSQEGDENTENLELAIAPVVKELERRGDRHAA